MDGLFELFSMANDTEILHYLWNGKLPICFKLDEQEIHGIQNPEPFYLMVPRMSYFPLVCDKVRIRSKISCVEN